MYIHVWKEVTKRTRKGNPCTVLVLKHCLYCFFSEYYEWEGRRVERYIFGFTSRKISLRELPKKAHAIQMLHFIANIEDQSKWNFVSKSLHNLKVTEIWPLTKVPCCMLLSKRFHCRELCLSDFCKRPTSWSHAENTQKRKWKGNTNICIFCGTTDDY